MNLQLQGKVVIVTGASRGIGRATARLLACEGASLLLAARSTDALTTLADECGAVCVTQSIDLRGVSYRMFKAVSPRRTQRAQMSKETQRRHFFICALGVICGHACA